MKRVILITLLCAIVTVICLRGLLFEYPSPIGRLSTVVHWYSTNDDLPSDVQSLATAPVPSGTSDLPPIFYAGTWGDGVYRSVRRYWQP